MKRLHLISLLLLVLPIAAAPTTCAEESAVQLGGSAAQTRWHPPPLSLTKDNEPAGIPLAGIISSVQMSAEPTEITLAQLRGISVTVHNGTDTPLIIDADKAVITVADTAMPSAQTDRIDKAACPGNAPAKKVERTIEAVTVAAVTLGAVQTVKDVVVQDGPVLKRYGCDEERRHDESQAFSRRVVWPGDTRQGIIYFSTARTLHSGVLKVPVEELFNPTEQATLALQL